MNINPNAVLFFLFGTGLGYAVDGNRGALIGFLVTAGISLLGSLKR